jgi:hypothetical protein
MSTNNNLTTWALIIAAWGAITGTASLGIQWWNVRYKFREPLYLRGDINTKTRIFTFTIRNRDPRIPVRIEKIYQLRRSKWWSLKWYEFQPKDILYKGKIIGLPFEVGPRTAETYTIKNEYFERAINRTKNRNAEPVLFSIKAGSGDSFRLKPKINGEVQA